MKRILCLTVAVILALGMLPMSVLAADSYGLGLSANMDSRTLDLQTVYPVTKYYLDVQLGGQPVPRTTVRSDKLDVKVKTSKGSQVIDQVSLTYNSDGNAVVEVAFIKQHVSIKEVDFELQIYLTKNKSRLGDTSITLLGTMDNHVEYVNANTDYVNMTDSPVVEAEEYIKNIEVYLGADVTIYARMNAGKRYYAYATRSPADADIDKMNKYGFEDTYSLTTINMNGGSNRVVLDTGSVYHVYNSGLEYIGTTNDRLPYSTRYYLHTSRVEIDGDDITPGEQLPDDDDLDDWDDKDGPDADGNGNVGSAGKNPNTGVDNYVNVAIATGLVSLAVAGAVAFKKKKS